MISSRYLSLHLFIAAICSHALHPRAADNGGPAEDVLSKSSTAALSKFESCILPAAQHVHFHDTCESLHRSANRDIDIFGMQGEHESVQLLLRHAESFEVEIESTVPFKLRWYQVGYVYTKANPRVGGSGGGWRPDPLLEVQNGDRVRVPGNFSQPFWLTWHLDASNASIEQGHLLVRIDGAQAITVPISVTISNFAVPSVFDAKVKQMWGFLETHLEPLYGSPVPTNIVTKFKDLLFQNRIPAPAHKGEFANHRVPIITIPLPYVGGLPYVGLPESDLPACRSGAQLNYTRLIASVAEVRKEVEDLTAEGWPVVYGYGKDEPDAACAGLLREAYSYFRKIPNLRIMAATNWKPEILHPDFPLDSWVQLYHEYDDQAAAAWKAVSGKELWGYHCVEPSQEHYLNIFIERPLIHARLLFWLAASRQYDGWLYWVDDLWKSCKEAHTRSGSEKHFIKALNSTHTALMDFDPASYIWCPKITNLFVNGDGYYMYPGEHGPITSQRLEQIRDGLEDLELLRMLPSPEAVAELVQKIVRSPTDWYDDPTLLKKLRKELLGRVSHQFGDPGQAASHQSFEIGKTHTIGRMQVETAPRSRDWQVPLVGPADSVVPHRRGHQHHATKPVIRTQLLKNSEGERDGSEHAAAHRHQQEPSKLRRLSDKIKDTTQASLKEPAHTSILRSRRDQEGMTESIADFFVRPWTHLRALVLKYGIYIIMAVVLLEALWIGKRRIGK